MKTLADYIREQTLQDPGFPARLKEAKAEVHLGVSIARRREDLGWTQQQLADATGIPQSSIARFERAVRTPTLQTLWRIADALNATVMVGPDHYVNVIPCAARAEIVEASTVGTTDWEPAPVSQEGTFRPAVSIALPTADATPIARSRADAEFALAA